MDNEIPMPEYDADVYEMAMNYRMVASQLFNAVMELVAMNGCKCVYAPEVREWHIRSAHLTSMADRMRYARENPYPQLDKEVEEVCSYCKAMNAYSDLVGDDVINLERSVFFRNNELMPAGLREIFDEELGHLTGEQLAEAFMLGSDNEEILNAIERAQKRANEYLKTYNNNNE